MGVLRRFQNFFTTPQLRTLYKGCCSPLYEVFLTHQKWLFYHRYSLKGGVQGFRFADSSTPTNSLSSHFLLVELLSHSLFYRHYNGHCPFELFSRIHPHTKNSSCDTPFYSFILSLSNSLTPDLTPLLNLTFTFLVNSGKHSLNLFS